MEPERLGVLAELHDLKKGRGVPGMRAVGPHLRKLCGVAEADSDGVARRKVATILQAAAGKLPPDQRLSALAALGLHPEAVQRFLKDRILWLATRLKRDDRTIRRYVDEALVALTRQLEADAVPPVPGPREPREDWDVRELSTLLRLDRPTPESVETRRVIANVDGLDHLEALVTVPRDPARRDRDHGLEAEVLYGVRIVGEVRETATRFRYRLRLPRALDRDETHEYAMVIRVPTGQLMRPHYVFASPHRCDRFDLRVRFDPERLPGSVWAVAEAYPRDFDEDGPEDDPRDVDGLGELHLVFRDLKRGLGYGARWSEAPSSGIRLEG